MDSALGSSLFFIMYFDMMVLTTLSCLKKRTEITIKKIDQPPTRTSALLQPKAIELNQKEKLIKGGLKTGKYAYPTFDDIKSDWSDKEQKTGGHKKSVRFVFVLTYDPPKPLAFSNRTAL
ncbi:unnamed protein product [Angiostrongylus costaricensis]|uniref:Uncharacterized protein n=1 Tax=Angiostrongylus costaricensis TaxID=334426 RepID=A0A0R3PQY6_ANGCS|nr:unnamed protein product [Angiostrongylus costaricensis]